MPPPEFAQEPINITAKGDRKPGNTHSVSRDGLKDRLKLSHLLLSLITKPTWIHVGLENSSPDGLPLAPG